MLRHARSSLLAPGAAVVPRALTVYASLVESEALASLGCVWRDATHGLDLRPLNALAHGFFDDLKQPGARCDENGGGPALPPLFDFTALELAACPGLAALRPPPAAATA